ncbi:UDP binding domain-containing protein [Streptomyces sp. NBC_01727]|uniref:UDP binding domain-containing protein n=1 Tax=unclassified Streptomyces TaxID=2593676 RepID=UPI002E14C417|nr:UDP binding domain-containing protein [Streptomyces sp. NBC_01727]
MPSHTDDIRDSPALAVAQKLHELGATVTVTDPRAIDNARKTHPELDFIDDPSAAVQNTDLLLHLTEWPQFSHIDPHQLAARAGTREGHQGPRHPKRRDLASGGLDRPRPRTPLRPSPPQPSAGPDSRDMRGPIFEQSAKYAKARGV